MNQEKIGNFIKNIRKQNNLTQKELADKLGVTYQAVSKWENGLNIPDIGIMRQISKMYNIDINEILDGEKKSKKKNIFIIIIFVIVILLFITIICIKNNKNSNDIKLNTISTSCLDFKINGSAAYNEKKASLYISQIDYCGVTDDTIYDSISCILYEERNDKKVEINSCDVINNITLEDYLKEINIKVNNYSSACKSFSDAKLYLEINAVDNSLNREYIIPINLDNDCK